MVGMYNGAATSENSLAFPQRLNIEFPYILAILHTIEIKKGINTKVCVCIFIVALLIIAKKVETT